MAHVIVACTVASLCMRPRECFAVTAHRLAPSLAAVICAVLCTSCASVPSVDAKQSDLFFLQTLESKPYFGNQFTQYHLLPLHNCALQGLCKVVGNSTRVLLLL